MAKPPAKTTPKPRVRVQAGTTRDSFMNAEARLGFGQANTLSAGGYGFNFTTRLRTELEAGYRGNWMIGKAVDVIADDMTQSGITLESKMQPDDEQKMYAAIRDLLLMQRLGDNIRWARLFGGSGAVLMIEGEDYSTPLKMDRIRKGSFKGLWVLDRWVLIPDATQVVTEFGPDFGLPKYYYVVADPQQGFDKGYRIHHTRVLRAIGVRLPYYQRTSEQLWGMSVIERIFDRIIAYDSTAMGAAQLVFKAHLRTIYIEGYRELLAAGGKMFEAVMAQLEHIRRFQTNEGLTVLDAKDKAESTSYTFAGLTDLLTWFAQEVSACCDIPMTRMFAQSPGGLNATGDSDLQNYGDMIAKNQETDLRENVTTILDVLHWSIFGAAPPEGFSFAFNPVWQMSESEKAEVSKSETESVVSAYEGGVITQKTALLELKASGKRTGMWSNITEEEIKAAEDMTAPEANAERALEIAETEPEPGDGDGNEE